LDDVNLTNLNLNQILVYDGSEWVNQNNEIPGAIKFRGACDLTKSIADADNDDVDNDPNDRIYGYFWVNSSAAAGPIDASWIGLSGDCQGLEYVVWTVGNDFAILGRTGDIAPVIEVHPGTGIDIDYNESPGNKSQPTINLADTAVTPGVYAAATVTVDQQGRLTDVVAGYNGSDGALDDILADYLPLAGGTLTGDLLLEDKITLNATIGSAQFEGNIFTGDSENGNIGAIIAPTNAGITFNTDDGGNFFTGFNVTSDEVKFQVGSTGNVKSEGEIEGLTLVSLTDVNVGQDLGVTRNATIGGNLDVTGDTGITGILTIGEFTLPNTDGVAEQVLVTDGAGNVTWQEMAGGANVTTSDTPPTVDVEPGDLWFDTTVGILYVYLLDEGGSNQWVDTRPGGSGGGSFEDGTIEELPPLPS
jgi:hypothetical protein